MEREAGKTKAWVVSFAMATLALATPAIAFAAPLVFEAAGSAPADIQAAVEEFRNFLGDDNTVGGTFTGGRRELNGDGVPDQFDASDSLPAHFLNKHAPRGGVVFPPRADLA